MWMDTSVARNWNSVSTRSYEAGTAIVRDGWLARLRRARRTLDRLDWWRLDEWKDSDLWAFDDGEAALLIAPPDLDETAPLDMTRAGVAWLRWCAVADGVSLTARLAAAFYAAESRLASHGVREVWCVIRPFEWIKPYLRDLGFRVADWLLIFEVQPECVSAKPSARIGLQVRPACGADLAALCALDAQAFDEPWRYPPALMRRALAQSFAFAVAVHEGAPVGYACAVLHEARGHIVRLAVRPDLRRRGIASELLRGVVAQLAQAGAHVVSLNTQAGNRPAQRLYRRLGFVLVDEKLTVMRRPLVHRTDQGRT